MKPNAALSTSVNDRVWKTQSRHRQRSCNLVRSQANVTKTNRLRCCQLQEYFQDWRAGRLNGQNNAHNPNLLMMWVFFITNGLHFQFLTCVTSLAKIWVTDRIYQMSHMSTVVNYWTEYNLFLVTEPFTCQHAELNLPSSWEKREVHSWSQPKDWTVMNDVMKENKMCPENKKSTRLGSQVI